MRQHVPSGRAWSWAWKWTSQGLQGGLMRKVSEMWARALVGSALAAHTGLRPQRGC